MLKQHPFPIHTSILYTCSVHINFYISKEKSVYYFTSSIISFHYWFWL